MKLNHVITIDFETYYDKEYSLTRMPTSTYVGDDRFEVIGVGTQLDNDDPVWCSITKDDSPTYPFLFHAAIANHLHSLPWEDSIVVAHNAQFDGLILETRFDIHPQKYFCTMMAARPIFGHRMGVSLAALTKELGVGLKGTAVHNYLGKHAEHFTPEERERYGEYCKRDVRLSYILYQLFNSWHEERA